MTSSSKEKANANQLRELDHIRIEIIFLSVFAFSKDLSNIPFRDFRVKTFVKPKPNKNSTNSNNATSSSASGNNSKPSRKLKVELPTLRLTDDGEKLLYETLKEVCGEVSSIF